MNTHTKSTENMEIYLTPTYFVDSDHPDIIEWANEVVGDAKSDVEKAIRLYYDVRDGVFYNPYRVKLTKEWLKASATLTRGRSFCVPKAMVLAAGARAVGIPSKLGYANVRNHVTSQKLLDALQSDVFAFHGYVELFLDGSWVKVSPTFNELLCDRAGIEPLEFDGKNDALSQEYNLEGNRFMEFITDHGTFSDFPYDKFIEEWQRVYPHLFEGENAMDYDGDFMSELAEERTKREEVGGHFKVA